MKDPDRVFDGFFTTKENGMGMAICRSIVQAHKRTPLCGIRKTFGLDVQLHSASAVEFRGKTSDDPIVFVGTMTVVSVREALCSRIASVGLRVTPYGSAAEFLEASKADALCPI